MKRKLIISITVVSAILICAYRYIGDNNSFSKTSDKPLSNEIYSYWKNNKAEISSFDLKQVRYGEIRNGHAVMIFVTEPFLPNTQVKYDGKNTDETRVEILKLNLERYFKTGIYQYSMMTSVFTPFNAAPDHPYKVTTSSQDWCGHTFFQLNNRDNNFEVSSYSYFQEFGDQNFSTPKAILEDELWNRIRLDINSLPVGEINIIPSTQYLRFVHLEPKALNAKAELLTVFDEVEGKEVYSYNIVYGDHERTMQIIFEKELPHRILGWKEFYYPLIFKGERKLMTTEARLKKSINIDYWNKNSNSDSIYRTELGL